MKKIFIPQTRRAFLRFCAVIATGISAKTLGATDKSALSSEDSKNIASLSYEDAKRIRRERFKISRLKRLLESKRKLSNQGCGKWRIHILGTWCGSEPNPKHNHTSWVLEKPSGELLWFDAGEYCSWTASNMNLDITQTKNVFLSHPHLDHTGGFIGLVVSLYNHLRFANHKNPKFVPDGFTVYASDDRVIRATEIIWDGKKRDDIAFVPLKNGEIYRDKDVVVEALENRHMKPTLTGKILSYSFRIKLLSAPHKTLIFSGDIKGLDDMDSFFKSGVCDLLMVESGHHLPEDHCINLKKNYPNAVKDILFLHHGDIVVDNIPFEKVRCESVWGKPVIFAQDKQTINL